MLKEGSLPAVHPDAAAQTAVADPPRAASARGLLLRFLGGLLLVFGLTSLYVWQTSTLSAIDRETEQLRREVVDLQQQNVALMLDVAAWNRPDYIERKAVASAMVPADDVTYLTVPTARSESDDQLGPESRLSEQWQRFLDQVTERLRALRQAPDLLRGTVPN